MIGSFNDGSVHLNPLESVLQLRPSFSYLDKADKKNKIDAESDEIEEESKEATPITVKFARRESAIAKARRVASYEFMQKQHEEEQWVHMEHYTVDHPISESYRNRLPAQNTEYNLQFQMDEKLFLKKVMPVQVAEIKRKTPLPSNVLSLAQLSTMPLLDQIRALLINTKVIRFEQLMSLLSPGE